MNIRKITLFSVFFFFVATTFAQQDETIVALRKKYAESVTLELAFDLDIFWKVREKHEKKNGLLYSMPGDKFRLKLGTWVWVCDGLTYWQYNEQTNQVVIKKLLDIDLSMHPSQMMKSYLSYAFNRTTEDDKEAVYAWAAADEEQGKVYSAITLWVDKKKNSIKKILVVDKKGNESSYTFLRIKTGEIIPPETFTFVTPKGVEVVDTRE